MIFKLDTSQKQNFAYILVTPTAAYVIQSITKAIRGNFAIPAHAQLSWPIRSTAHTHSHPPQDNWGPNVDGSEDVIFS